MRRRSRASGSPIGGGRADVRPEGAVVRSLVERVGEDAATSDARRSLELVSEELAGEVEAILA